MVVTGRSGRSWIRHATLIFAFAGCVLGQSAVQNVTNTSDSATTHETRCPAKNVWEVEAEMFQYPICLETRWGRGHDNQSLPAPSVDASGNDTAVESVATPGGTTVVTTEQKEQDQDTDSLLDSASFLSFEDWKKQNLAKVGQSAENVGGGRRAVAVGKEGRRQPGINNALDSLGDDAEIELDFGGFGAETPEASPTAWATPIPSQYAEKMDDEVDESFSYHGAPPMGASHRKDAGTTCKERFNYASFDCAATVLKTNPECKGSSAVLVEHKDSYMLNECQAKNKFLILELCDDILVDTVVLANYEFFSSIFHTFRVSVSDRYPAKPDQWKELGVYEARNTREVQAFAVENSLIWARYLRIEFLTHYGHEFYCPVSLIRVHGTTMMEEYKHDESVSRADEEVVNPIKAVEPPSKEDTKLVEPPAEAFVPEDRLPETCRKSPTKVELILLRLAPEPVETCSINDAPKPTPKRTVTKVPYESPSKNSTSPKGEGAPATHSGPISPPKAAEDIRKPGESAKVVPTTPDASVPVAETAQQNSTAASTGKSTSNIREESHNIPPEAIKPTSTQPPPSNPTTQESFFKSVHKRLQMLESNSSLSLLYIEEQSRILRNAFNKVEKRQLAKTSTFLENLNITVLNELKEFREQYDHVWKSVALEFEHQRVRYHQEVHSMSAQLGVLADELVFQKRVTVIQSIMVLCCFALVLFSRGSVSNYMEFPRVQRMVSRSSYSLRSSSPIFVSPSASPGSTRPGSGYRENSSHQRNLSDSSSSQGTPASPTVAYIPPTPTSEASPEVEEEKPNQGMSSNPLTVPPIEATHFRSHSTPPVLCGHDADLETDGESDDSVASPEEFTQLPA